MALRAECPIDMKPIGTDSEMEQDADGGGFEVEVGFVAVFGVNQVAEFDVGVEAMGCADERDEVWLVPFVAAGSDHWANKDSAVGGRHLTEELGEDRFFADRPVVEGIDHGSVKSSNLGRADYDCMKAVSPADHQSFGNLDRSW